MKEAFFLNSCFAPKSDGVTFYIVQGVMRVFLFLKDTKHPQKRT